MPVFALYNFEDGGTVIDSAVGNGAQNGIYVNGATAVGGDLTLDGINDFAKIYPDPAFQLDRGTLEINFTTGAFAGDGAQTVLSRDSVGENQGSYRVEVTPDGSVVVTHEVEGASQSYATGPGFFTPGDTLNLTYSWDQGADGGYMALENISSGDSFAAEVPASVTMDMADQSQPWIVGAGQSNSLPDVRNDIDEHFSGTVEVFSLSDSVDNLPDGPCPPDRDGIVRGTDGNDVIDTAYIDPFDADRVDANDAILGDDAPNDDRIYAGAGDDTILAGLGDDTVRAGDGNDLVSGGSGDDDLRGNAGDDTLNGQNGSDIAYGQQGNDIIFTGGTAQPLPDIDYPGLYAADSDPLDDLDSVYGGLGNDYISTGDDADLASGDDGRDTLDGGVDDDTLFGGQGGDVLIGSEGRDSIEGGEGSDLIYGGLDDSFPEAVNIPDAAGDLRPNNNTDLLFGGTGDDTISGRDDDDTLFGGVGRDLLDGGVDEDSIYGDAGNDTVLGSEGADGAYGGDDRDVFTIATEANGAGDFIDGNEGGDDYDTLDLTGSGPLNLTYAADNPENGRVDFLDGDGNITGTLNFINIENVIPCFTPGTLIATPKGEVPVEHLKIGDKIITRDNGIQEIRWLGSKPLNWQDFNANPHLKPVLVRRGSLGHDLPEQDMMVSPNHRLLVANDRTALYFDEHEVLVAAKHLVGSDGVHAVDSIGTSYIHFMFDQHEVVLSNGAWTESFQPGDYTLKGMGNAQRSEIFDLFPDLKTESGREGYTAARRTLKRHEARLLVR